MALSSEKPLFSIKDVLYFLTIFAGFGFQYVTMKIQIHDAISEVTYNKKETDFRISAIENNDTKQDKNINSLYVLCSPALKPKEPKIESE